MPGPANVLCITTDAGIAGKAAAGMGDGLRVAVKQQQAPLRPQRLREQIERKDRNHQADHREHHLHPVAGGVESAGADQGDDATHSVPRHP